MARRKPSDTVKLNLRFPESLRRLLEHAGKKHQWSMNAEIVRRLEDSFQYEKVFGNERTLILLKLISSAVDMIERSTGKPWDYNPEMFEAVLGGIKDIARAAGFAGMKPGERPDELEALKQGGGVGAAIVEMTVSDRELIDARERDLQEEVMTDLFKKS
jgi:hypothetical protein